MRITKCWVLAILLSYYIGLNAQSIQIGSGNFVNTSLPIEPYMSYNYTQMIYPAALLSTTATIDSIGFCYRVTTTSFLQKVNHLSIFMGTCTQPSFTSPAWISPDNLQLVFQGDWTTNDFQGGLPGSGEVMLPLSTPYAHQSGQNLVIAVCETMPSFGGNGDDFYCFATTNAQALSFRSDEVVPNPSSPPTGTLFQINYLPNLLLHLSPIVTVPHAPIPTDNSTTVGINPILQWSVNADSCSVFFTHNPDNWDLVAAHVTNYTCRLPYELEYQTDYYWKVKAYQAGVMTEGPIWHFVTEDASTTDIPWTADFTGTNFPPPTWQLLNGLYEVGAVLESTSYGWERGEQGATLAIYGRDCHYWLVTPMLRNASQQALSLQFTLDVADTQSQQPGILGIDDRFVLLYRETDQVEWQRLPVIWEAERILYNHSQIIVLLPTGLATIQLAWYGESQQMNADNTVTLSGIRLESYNTVVSPPTNLVVTQGTNCFSLQWTASGSGATHYVVYRNGGILTQAVQGTDYQDTAISQDIPYLYWVTAVSGDGESSPSNAVYVQYTAEDSLLFADNFNAYPSFLPPSSSYQCVDLDQMTTYGIDGVAFPGSGQAGSFQVFDPSACVPTLIVPGIAVGDKVLACFAASIPPNNDWLILPSMRLGTGSYLRLAARSLSEDYGLDRFRICVSTSGSSPASFIAIHDEPYISPLADWGEYEFSLTAFDNQVVRIGIQCVSWGSLCLLLDDLSVHTYQGVSIESPVAIPEPLASVYPNPLCEDSKLILHKDVNSPITLKLFNGKGQLVERIKADTMRKKGDIFMLSSLFHPGRLAHGIYFLQLSTKEEKLLIKTLWLH